MSVYMCHECAAEVRGGEAILRSVSFRQVAYCRDCWENHTSPVPQPRAAAEDAWERERQDV